MAWIDSHKAFDSVPHGWRLKILDLFKAFHSVPHSWRLSFRLIQIFTSFNKFSENKHVNAGNKFKSYSPKW